MKFLGIGSNLNDFQTRISRIEADVGMIEQSSTVEKLGEIKDYNHLVTTESSFWSQVELIAKLDDEVSAAISENVTLEEKKPGKQVKTLVNLNKLSERVTAAMVAVMGAIRRLSRRKDELHKELKEENARNYNRYVGALPDDWDEGC